MSKIINIPGTTDFIPLDDIINIKIKGKLSSKQELVIPEDSSSTFGIKVGNYAEFEVVTTYVDDTAAEDEDDADNEKPQDKTASITWFVQPLTPQSLVTELTTSAVYLSMSEKDQRQTDIRLEKYIEYLKYIELRNDLLTKMSNLKPDLVEDETESSAVEEEEENNPNSITTLVPINASPDETKLQEINAYLEDENNSPDRQAKRIEWLEKRYKESKTELVSDDGYKFIELLKAHNLDASILTALSDTLAECIEEVKNITN